METEADETYGRKKSLVPVLLPYIFWCSLYQKLQSQGTETRDYDAIFDYFDGGSHV